MNERSEAPPRAVSAPLSRVSVPELRRMKARGEKVTVITAYDATF